MLQYDTHIVRVVDVKDGWALVQFDDRRCRYLNMNRVDPKLMEVYYDGLQKSSTSP